MTSGAERLAEALGDRYRIERELGQGGMATVFLAADLKHDRKVAIKVLKPELAAVLGAERFVQEIKTTAALSHPHILPLFDSGQAGGRAGGQEFLYYVMPYIQGETVREKLNRESQFGVDEAVKIATEVADALDYAHRHGVIHRDIKPENILLHDGRPMVMDFGIALAVSAAAGGRMTETGLSLGTPHYMSPEQATADRAITARSDIYSLAAVLYEMLAGEPPHLGHSAQQIIMKIVTDTPRPVTELRKSVPPGVSAALAKALEKVPADRFESARAFADALGDSGFTAARQPRAGKTGGTAWSPLSIVTTAIAVLALAGMAWRWSRPERMLPVRTLRLALDPSQPLFTAGSRLSLAPDGSAFAYIGGDSTPGLLYRAFDQLGARMLPGTEGAVTATFSPDGTRMAFVNNGLQVVGVNGAPAVRIASTASPGGVAWSGEDWIYFDSGESIERVRPDGSARESVVGLDTTAAEIGLAWPEPLPAGNAMLYRSRRTGGDPSSYVIKAIDLRTRQVKVLVQAVVARYLPPDHLVYVTGEGALFAAPFDADQVRLTGPPLRIGEGLLPMFGFGSVDLTVSRTGDIMYVTSAASSSLVLSWVDQDGTGRPVDQGWHVGVESLIGWSLSPDGHKLAAVIGNVTSAASPSDIWVKDLDSGALTKLTFAGINVHPAWTRDGKTIYYVSARVDDPDGSGAVYRIRSDGGGTPELLVGSEGAPGEVRNAGASLAAAMGALAVSPADGRVVVEMTPRGGGPPRLMTFRPDVDTMATPLLPAGEQGQRPSISPDGRWIAYGSNISGVPEVIVRPFPQVESGRWQVSTGGGELPAWSPLGNALYYATPTGQFVTATVTTSPSFSVTRRERLYPGTSGMRGFVPALDGRHTLRFWPLNSRAETGQQVVLLQNIAAALRAPRR